MYVWMDVYMYVYMYVCMYVYVHTYVCVCVCMYILRPNSTTHAIYGRILRSHAVKDFINFVLLNF